MDIMQPIVSSRLGSKVASKPIWNELHLKPETINSKQLRDSKVSKLEVSLDRAEPAKSIKRESTEMTINEPVESQVINEKRLSIPVNE